MARKKECLKSIMEFFGVEFLAEVKNHEQIGTCFGCDKEEHLYLNTQKNVFQCHRCGLHGNTHNFLEYTWLELKAGLTLIHLEALASYRKLPLEAFTTLDIGYKNGIYYFPVCRPDNGKFTDFRWYKIGEKTKSLSGAITGVYGFEKISSQAKNFEKVHLCEGEFDAIALNYLFKKTDRPEYAISLPGANNVKREWIPYLTNQHVNCCFDNDGAGRAGQKKVYDLLQPPVANSLSFINWPDLSPPGYDVNDFVVAMGVKTNDFRHAHETLKTLIAPLKDPDKKEEPEATPITIDHRVTFSELIEKYATNLDLNTNYIEAIKIGLATIMSIDIFGPNPVWLFLVGPPGYGKTALLSSFRKSSKCVFQSSLSKHNLVSGFDTGRNNDPSIFPRLKNKCLILKDYTEILSKSQVDRNEIFSILRGAYDGSVEREFGNSVKRVYSDLNFPILAGVTDEINNHSTASVGERFLKYDMHSQTINQERQQEKALESALFGKEDEEELHSYVHHFLCQEWDFSKSNIRHILRNSEYSTKLNALCRLAVWIRTPVVRHEYGNKQNHIAYAPRRESPNRITVQLNKLAISMAILEGKNTIDKAIYTTIKKIALNTVGGYTLKLLELIRTKNTPTTLVDLATHIRLGRHQANMLLEDLELTSLIMKEKVSENGSLAISSFYKLSPETRQLWEKI